jgi:hypothetical protein
MKLTRDSRWTSTEDTMLLVVFGAGASYDSISADPPHSGGERDPHRLPLAKELFADRPHFTDALNEFSKAAPLFPVLHSGGGELGIEAALERIWSRTPRRSTVVQQFTALRYYIQRVIGDTEKLWLGKRKLRLNHISLIEAIDSVRPQDETVLFVTFNYDTLIESALAHFDIHINSLEDYTTHRIKLFKLHGSINWHHLTNVQVRPSVKRGIVHTPKYLIDHAGNYGLTSRYFMASRDKPLGDMPDWCLPAIAVPTQTKDGFECPEWVVAELVKHLPAVDHVLTIGWRASDPSFLALLTTHMKQPVRLSVVAENATIADRIGASLGTVLNLSLSLSIGRGFSGFIEDQWVADNLGPQT